MPLDPETSAEISRAVETFSYKLKLHANQLNTETSASFMSKLEKAGRAINGNSRNIARLSSTVESERGLRSADLEALRKEIRPLVKLVEGVGDKEPLQVRLASLEAANKNLNKRTEVRSGICRDIFKQLLAALAIWLVAAGVWTATQMQFESTPNDSKFQQVEPVP